jgi:hypothetical protein
MTLMFVVFPIVLSSEDDYIATGLYAHNATNPLICGYEKYSTLARQGASSTADDVAARFSDQFLLPNGNSNNSIFKKFGASFQNLQSVSESNVTIGFNDLGFPYSAQYKSALCFPISVD